MTKPGPKGSRLDRETQARIRAAVKMGGLSQSETARKLGVSRAQVRTVLEHAGIIELRPSRGGLGNPRAPKENRRCPTCGRVTA